MSVGQGVDVGHGVQVGEGVEVAVAVSGVGADAALWDGAGLGVADIVAVGAAADVGEGLAGVTDAASVGEAAGADASVGVGWAMVGVGPTGNGTGVLVAVEVLRGSIWGGVGRVGKGEPSAAEACSDPPPAAQRMSRTVASKMMLDGAQCRRDSKEALPEDCREPDRARRGCRSPCTATFFFGNLHASMAAAAGMLARPCGFRAVVRAAAQ